MEWKFKYCMIFKFLLTTFFSGYVAFTSSCKCNKFFIFSRIKTKDLPLSQLSAQCVQFYFRTPGSLKGIKYLEEKIHETKINKKMSTMLFMYLF